jgi:hypothetical protein
MSNSDCRYSQFNNFNFNITPAITTGYSNTSPQQAFTQPTIPAESDRHYRQRGCHSARDHTSSFSTNSSVAESSASQLKTFESLVDQLIDISRGKLYFNSALYRPDNQFCLRFIRCHSNSISRHFLHYIRCILHDQ